MKVRVAGMERAKMWAGPWGPSGLCPYLKSKDDTQGRIGGRQEGIQFHSMGCGTQRHTRKKALERLVLEKHSPQSTA